MIDYWRQPLKWLRLLPKDGAGQELIKWFAWYVPSVRVIWRACELDWVFMDD